MDWLGLGEGGLQGERNRRQLIRWRFGCLPTVGKMDLYRLGIPPNPTTLQNVSAPQGLHLPCPLASRSHRRQRLHPQDPLRGCSPVLGLQNSKCCPQLFLNLTLGTCNGNYSCRFPRFSLQSALSAPHRTGPHRPPLTPFIKNSSHRLRLILCWRQTALFSLTECLHGSINFRLSSPFSAPAPPGRGPSRISPAPGPLQARCALPIPDPVSRFCHPQPVVPTVVPTVVLTVLLR